MDTTTFDEFNRATARRGAQDLAEHRTRVRRGIGCVALVAVALVGAAACGRPSAVPPPIGARPSPTVPGPAASPSPPDSPAASSGSPGPSGSPGVPDCRPADLDPRPVYDGQGAAGTGIGYVIVRNQGPGACRLATYPTLLATDAGTGALTPVPSRRTASTQNPVLLKPGRWAVFDLAYASGPVGPSCHPPVPYRGLWLVLADGRRYPLPGFEIDLICVDVRVGPWRLSTWPDRPEGANPRVAPAPS